jgi:CDP-4-dehydro-6-deoxyglucose reductase
MKALREVIINFANKLSLSGSYQMSSPRQIFKMKVEKIVDHTSHVRELILKCTDQHLFQFKAGQFVMLHVPTGEKPALRAYSLASSETIQDGFHLLFKFVPQGVASTFVWSLRGDETLDFTGPFGRVFFQEPPAEQIIFLNTGTGLSQHYCYLQSKKHLYPNIKYRLLFGLRNESEIYYQPELMKLKSELPDFNFDFVLSNPESSWKGKIGYIQHHLKDFDYKSIKTHFYLCGNGHMIKDTKKLLIEDQGINKDQIFCEAFD